MSALTPLSNAGKPNILVFGYNYDNATHFCASEWRVSEKGYITYPILWANDPTQTATPERIGHFPFFLMTYHSPFCA